MEREEVNPFLIEDFIEDLKKVESLLALHQNDRDDFMLQQWQYRKKRVFDELLDHIQTSVWQTDLPDRLAFIHQLTKRFYPEALETADLDFENGGIKTYFLNQKMAVAA